MSLEWASFRLLDAHGNRGLRSRLFVQACLYACVNLYLLSLLSRYPRVRDNRDRWYNRRIRQAQRLPAVDDVLENLKARGGLVERVGDIAGINRQRANVLDASGLGAELIDEPLLARVEFDGGFAALSGGGSLFGGLRRRTAVVFVARLTNGHAERGGLDVKRLFDPES
jgi:hypothetical protein